MSDVVINCEQLSKSYLIGHEGPRERYTTLRDAISRQMRGMWNRTRRALRENSTVAGDQIEEFWALRNVSFELKRGEVLGIIGRNGAGKSTLLKILSRITEPTTGRITLRGRVASLLEVGTGFHPELTGRENVFLNGAILGMTRAEIKRKFDEIVAFSEVEKFIDTPVKRYSSGMYVRLAFAVAAHLEPEILIVDEVLAVGDAEFQKKCLGKMKAVSKDGRTVLFVSHNMAAIQNLCDLAVLLRNGEVVCFDKTEHALEAYIATAPSSTSGSIALDTIVDRQGLGNVRFQYIRMADGKHSPIDCAVSGRPLHIIIKINGLITERIRHYRIGFSVRDLLGAPLFLCATECAAIPPELECNGGVVLRIPRLPLSGGRYSIGLYLEINGQVQDWIQGAAILAVEDGDYFGKGKTTPSEWGGLGVLVDHEWNALDEARLSQQAGQPVNQYVSNHSNV